MQSKLARLFRIAKKESQNSNYYYRIGSVLVTKSGEIFKGYNKANKTHTKSNHSYKTIHAELDAILKVGIHNKAKINGATMVLYRETTHGLACSKPCKFCQKILNEFDIKKIYYTDIDGYWCVNKNGEVEKIS